MFELTYSRNGEVVTKNFESYLYLVLFVAENKIMDNEFVSMRLGDSEFDSLSAFAEFVSTHIHNYIDATENAENGCVCDTDEDCCVNTEDNE